jgi:zinc transporter 5/7
MQRQPRALDDKLTSCYQRVMQLEGVYSVQEPHFWTLCSDYYVGSVKLEVARNADPRYVIQQTTLIFQGAGVRSVSVHLDFSLT